MKKFSLFSTITPKLQKFQYISSFKMQKKWLEHTKKIQIYPMYINFVSHGKNPNIWYWLYLNDVNKYLIYVVVNLKIHNVCKLGFILIFSNMEETAANKILYQWSILIIRNLDIICREWTTGAAVVWLGYERWKITYYIFSKLLLVVQLKYYQGIFYFVPG